MNVLIACEESQTVCVEMRKLGHNAFSCDILECSGGHPEWHIQGDVLPLLNGFCSFETMDGTKHRIDSKWDLIIAHPPCTDLSSSGQWAYSRGFKDTNLREKSVAFFMEFVNADCERIAIENPVGIMSTRYRKPNQVIHPWQFGHNAEKSTCLWLKGLPNLMPTTTEKPVLEYFEWVDKKTGKKKRMQKWMYENRCSGNKEKKARLASKTFEGIGRAMAAQWGKQERSDDLRQKKECSPKR